MANYQQPDYRIPVTPGVEVRPHPLGHRGGNPLGLDAASLPDYVQTGTNAVGVETVKFVPAAQLSGGPMGISGSGPSGGK
jgi:hypothetical protein